MGSEILELKWANHKSNMTSELQELYLNDALFDVTIACGEYSLKAHKTVLSASSAFFRKLFIENPCKHPILIMTDVDFGDLKAIVEFMYHGEIHVAREKLSHFLKIAEKLMVKGLSNIENMNLNLPVNYEAVTYPRYCSGTKEQGGVQSQLENEPENIKSNKGNITDSTENVRNEEMPVIKLEDDVSHSDSRNCMYWESERCDQTSSVVIPDYDLSDSSVSHQLSFQTPSHKVSASSVSRQLLIPDQLPTTSVSHHLSPSSASCEASSILDKTESSSHVGVPLSGEAFTHSNNQMETTAVKVPEESTGIDNNPVNLYLSQDQPCNNIPTTSKSFETKESSNNSPQDENTNKDAYTYPMQCVSDGSNAIFNREENCCAPKDFSYVNSSNFESSICKNSFPIQDTFDNNGRSNPKITKFICDIREKRFSSESSLQQHSKMHSSDKLFQSRVGNKRIAWQSALQHHKRTHMEDKPLLCKVCKKPFSNRQTLQYHERTHMEEKPFFCKVCERQFLMKSHLQCHERTHTGEKPFFCNFCKREFSLKQTLQRHERTHTGEKPFLCKVCKKQFSRKDILQYHESTHNDNQLECKRCQKQFSSKRAFRFHEKMHNRRDSILMKHFSQMA